jgi:hypothetical protein
VRLPSPQPACRYQDACPAATGERDVRAVDRLRPARVHRPHPYHRSAKSLAPTGRTGPSAGNQLSAGPGRSCGRSMSCSGVGPVLGTWRARPRRFGPGCEGARFMRPGSVGTDGRRAPPPADALHAAVVPRDRPGIVPFLQHRQVGRELDLQLGPPHGFGRSSGRGTSASRTGDDPFSCHQGPCWLIRLRRRRRGRAAGGGWSGSGRGACRSTRRPAGSG